MTVRVRHKALSMQVFSGVMIWCEQGSQMKENPLA